jgi:hypothetical protein
VAEIGDKSKKFKLHKFEVADPDGNNFWSYRDTWTQ